MSRIFNPSEKVLCHLDTVDKYLKNQKYDPITIEIDPSNACNHSCPFCISGHLHLKKFQGTELFNRTMLSESVFQNLIEDLTKTNIKAINWTGGGEPTQNPYLGEAIKFIKKNSKIEMGMFSNGSLLERFNLFNNLTIILALASMPLAFTYPLMKRFTYWPQLFLGITFNYGLVLGWTAIQGEINVVSIIFYLGAIFWTLGFDTIYGYQDIKDDEIIGVKSTSIKFKKNPKLFLNICYLIFVISLVTVGFFMNFKLVYYFFLMVPTLHLFFYQVYNFNFKDPKNSLKIFKSNNLLGIIVLLNILVGKI